MKNVLRKQIQLKVPVIGKKNMSIISSVLMLVFRSISNRYVFYKNYISIKLKYRGKAIFNTTTRIDLTSSFEGANIIGNNTKFCGNMGYGSYICNDCAIVGNVGRFCSIAHEVKNAQGVHPISNPYVSTSPMFFSLRKQTGKTFAQKQLFEEMKEPIEIGHDCWIGQRAFIVGGVKIGTGAVVLAGAVVTKDVPPYAVVGGVPARILKYRYDEETIDFLLRSEWWNMPIEWLEANYELFSNIDEFKRIINETISHNS